MQMRWAALATLTMVGGCGLASDSTGGDENRSSWSIDDGLCPGTEGGCALEVPVAAGTDIALDAAVHCAEPRRDGSGETVTDCELAALDVQVSGAASLVERSDDVGNGRLDLALRTEESGQATVELVDSGGEVFDRVTFDVRTPAELECGRVGPDNAQWDMRGIDRAGSWEVATAGADRVDNVELGCRLVDASGAPMLSAAAIAWRITEGGDIATIDDGGLFGAETASGARIWVRLDGRGTIGLEARFGTFTETLVVVAE